MARLRLRLFGGFDATVDGAPVTGFDSNKVRALLAYLAVESGRAHRRESLAALLWPGYPDRSARTNLRNALANLRTAIGDRETEPPFLLITRETLQFNRQSDHRLDVAMLGRALASVQDIPADQLVEIVDVYTGDFLAGFTLEDAVKFDDWASVTGERLRRQALELLGTLVDRLEAAGELDRALAYARRRVELEPWQESAQRQLIRLLAATGQRSAALRQYRECVRILEEELGAEPSAETVALYEELRARERSKATDTAEVPIASMASRPTRSRPPVFLDDSAEAPITNRPVFVGRAPELARLDGYLDGALAGQGQVAFVVGGPGRGKSSLMRAFADQAMAAHPDLLVVSGACNAYSGVGDAYLPFREVLGMLTGDVESRWRAGRLSRDHAHRLWSALPVTLPALVAHGPYVIDSFVPGTGVMSRAKQAGLDGAPWMPELRTLSNRSVAGGLAQQALFQQVTNILQAVAAEHPLLLVMDDLQWIDQGSIGLLFHLGRRLAGRRILIVGAYRPEEVAAGRSSGGVSEPHPLTKTLNEFRRDFGDVQIDLRQADQSEGRQFVDALIATEANRLGEAFRAALCERTGGHPLFTIELMHAMQARGDLRRDADGAWVEDESLNWAELPARVGAVIEERLGRLTQEERDLLAVASVEGEDFTPRVVAEVQGLGQRAVLQLLDGLARRHRLVREVEEVAVGGRHLSQYAFAHALFQAYLYDELSGGERRLLHGDVAAALETLYGEAGDGIAVQLAEHYDQAEHALKTIEWATRAGERAYTISAFREASQLFGRALELTSPENSKDRAMLLIRFGRSCEGLGDYPRATQHLQQGLTLSREVGRRETEVEALNGLSWIAFQQGAFNEAERYAGQALAQESDDRQGMARSLNILGVVASIRGDYEAAQRHFEESLVIRRAIGDRQGVANSVSNLGLVASSRGDYEVAWRYLEEGLAVNRETGHRQGVANSLNNLGLVASNRGNHEVAWRYLEESLVIYREIGNRRGIANSLCCLGHVAEASDDADAAWRCYRDALSGSAQIGVDSTTLAALVGVAKLLVQDRRNERAAELMGLVLYHPSTEADDRQRVELPLAIARKKLPAHQLEAALARGRLLDLQTAVQVLLEELALPEGGH